MSPLLWRNNATNLPISSLSFISLRESAAFVSQSERIKLAILLRFSEKSAFKFFRFRWPKNVRESASVAFGQLRLGSHPRTHCVSNLVGDPARN
jgi:hypothetical protein